MKEALSSPRLSTPRGVWSHAIKVPASGHLIFVAGMTSRDPSGGILGVGDIRAQTRQALENMKAILAEGGATLADVVKVTVYVRNIGDFEAIHELRREYFPQDPPASVMVEVSAMVDPAFLIEIDAVAVVGS